MSDISDLVYLCMYTQWFVLLCLGYVFLLDDGCLCIPSNLISCHIDFDDELND